MSGSRGEKKTPFLSRFYLGVLFVVLLDQGTKFLALHFLSPGQTIAVLPGIFHFTLVHNTGIAFGLFRGYEFALLAFITISLLVLVFWSRTLIRLPRPAQTGFALILGGAAGNWMDRIRGGAVIDFLDFRVWPVFNLADSAITLGVGLYVIYLLGKKEK